MLRLNFLTLRGDAHTLMIAACVRFAVDGTLRGPDNSVIARCLDGEWRVGGRLHREFECEGPVRVRLSSGLGEPARLLGPFRLLRTQGGILYGDDACLHIPMRGKSFRADDEPFPLSVTFERGADEKT